MRRAVALREQLHRLGVSATITPAGKDHITPSKLVPDSMWPELRAHRDEPSALAAARPPSEAWAAPAPRPVAQPPSDPRPELLVVIAFAAALWLVLRRQGGLAAIAAALWPVRNAWCGRSQAVSRGRLPVYRNDCPR